MVSNQLRFALIGRRARAGMSEVLPRYALYYAPRPEEALAVIASQWLGCAARRRSRAPAAAVVGARSAAPGGDHGGAAPLRLPWHAEAADGADRRGVRDATSSPRSAALPRASAPSIRRRSRSPNCRASWRWCRRAARPSCRISPTIASSSSTSSAGPRARTSWRGGARPASRRVRKSCCCAGATPMSSRNGASI